MDYISFADRGVRHLAELSPESRVFIERVESRLGVPVHFAFTGPSNEDVVDLESPDQLSFERALASSKS
jgi:adenylosuccinate synthase